MADLNQAKNIGGVGTILTILSFVPSIGPVLSIVGLVLLLLALKWISEIAQNPEIFRNALIAIVVGIVGGVIVGVVDEVGVLTFLTGVPDFLSLLTNIGMAIVIAWVFFVISAVFLRKSLNLTADHLDVKMFRTAGLLYLIGTVLLVFLVGLVVNFVAYILLAVAFFQIRAKRSYEDEFILQPIIVSFHMVCQNCGAENPLKSKVCRACGTKLYKELPGHTCPICLAPLKLARVLGPGHIMCSFCYSDFRIVTSSKSFQEKPEGQSIVKERKLGRKSKAIVVTICIFLLFIIAGSLLGPSNNNNHSSEIVIQKSVDELLPTREDLPTEWRIGDRIRLTSNATGFIEGAELTITKIEGFGAAGVTIKIYKFNTTKEAEKYFIDLVTNLKAKGGYKEISTNLRAKVYGTFFEAINVQISKIYFTKYNIYCEISARGTNYYDTKDDAIRLANLVLQKI